MFSKRPIWIRKPQHESEEQLANSMTASRCVLPQTQPSFSAQLIVPVAELIESSSPQEVSVGRYAGTGPSRTSYDRTELHLTPPDCVLFVCGTGRYHTDATVSKVEQALLGLFHIV
ncbi:unnamed protein product [Sphagnum jensenii]|jgi:hypothetical protein